MKKLLVALLGIISLSFAFIPSSPVEHILLPGDNLPKYNGSLDRVEFEVLDGAKAWSLWNFWPVDGLLRVSCRHRVETRYEITSPEIENIRLWFGGLHEEDITLARIYLPEYNDDPFLVWPTPMYWPTSDWSTYDPNLWAFNISGTKVHTYPWVLDNFEGEGELALNWHHLNYTSEFFFKENEMRRIPRHRYIVRNFKIKVTYYPAE